ncbi:uncharacterized protein LOC120664466 isoform X1 [Panicum virgatum]|uniref:Nuclease associated modular domain-containing protein n=2 Tax=Panicum virgatum TaxID=38727 RepID=A0A8T0U575_PANVG|nr:uncharacterized protein LOC120664466 isoform X1 [Panicum virgatum]KAG2617158.1 hypothetical protein PVAP13_3NG178822 [Panicum virgatum]
MKWAVTSRPGKSKSTRTKHKGHQPHLASTPAAGCSSFSWSSSPATVRGREAMAAASVHYARAYILMSFECGASSSSRKLLSRRKFCALVEPTLSHNELRKSSQLIQYREFISPKSSLKELACEELVGGMDDQWSNNTSYPDSVSREHCSVNKRNVEKHVQDHQLHHPQGGTYFTGLSKKEIERRRKIGAANKGQVPWTKGKKWSEEHKKLISQRTTQALRDPKVRKKMGHHHQHRQASKDKISAALRKIWERRILSVRSRQKFMQIWSDSIAEAAKRGDYSQDKLDWDSYERIKSEMISMFLWNKEREHTIKKLKKAVAKIAAKKLQAAGRRKVQAAGTKKLNPEKLIQKPDAQLTRVVVSARPKLKERLTKWHRRKKELEHVISSRARIRGLPNLSRRQITAESRAEVELVVLDAPSSPDAGASVI